MKNILTGTIRTYNALSLSRRRVLRMDTRPLKSICKVQKTDNNTTTTTNTKETKKSAAATRNDRQYRGVLSLEQQKRFFSEQPATKTQSKDPRILTKGIYPTDITENGIYIGSTYLEVPPLPLPQLNASAMLDSDAYSRNSALLHQGGLSNGSDAAKRLIKGRRRLVEMIRKEIHERNHEFRKLYILKGHGVPTAVLQHHLNSANQWLEQHNDVYKLSTGSVFDGKLKFDQLVVQTNSGFNRSVEWPIHWSTDMELFLTVMNRITIKLGSILNQKGEAGNNDLSYSQSQLTSRLKRWHVSIVKGNAIAPKLIPEHLELSPVIEFIPMGGFTGRVCIRLQGEKKHPVRGEPPSRVTMTFNCVIDVW